MVYTKAKKIKTKFKISSKSDVEYLKLVIHKLGHNVTTFSEERLKLALLLKKYEKSPKAISVMDKNGNITVYYNDKLPKPVQRFALAHEIGHIVLGHLNVYKGNEDQERDADNFAKYLLKPDISLKLYTIALFFVLSTILLLLSVAILYNPFASVTSHSVVNSDTSYVTKNNINNNTVCYYAKYSKVYHLYRDCYYIKHSKTVYTSTIGDCELDRLCSACERNLNKGR